ncbi:XRE family transcriptional regulator [Xanthomonas perforans]|jgi:transcriptional regulator with XRE-family HTH domain|uniref:Helix-turn-helix transcriptional regulator n=1 Tax=Xanthomonas perforans TaxID=442694 RepID=A0A6P0F5C6_XANPE|nr:MULTISPECIES: helix-turn-helix domain-containing protein [Xanthomonas]KLC00625.1 XRE family transcriptional regulator [Xanthomonas perforans]KLC27190.1 XRE family transcriptional regulator [Xanthomonas perforans]KLC29047.1 XRE family transcriptional regulator [Xanthomonas perforans]KLC52354.1 XRE family transcriptional regulator [Xanthomonas perforans]KLC68048.1 XRE family transcriptional regulator [Xanthomonas perforans]
MTTNFGNKIKNLRKDRGMTLDALAAAADMSKSYLWELENRDSPRPSVEKLASLAKALSMDVSYFLDQEATSPEERHLDQAFFRNYGELDATAKEQMRKIMETFKKS